MRRVIFAVLAAQAVAVLALGAAVASGAMPLGVRGEWEWMRLPKGTFPAWPDLLIGATAVLGFGVFAAATHRFLTLRPSRLREGLALAGLLLASVLIQSIVPGAAPDGYGLSKWTLALYSPGSSGYFTVARQQIRDPWRFLADYPRWIREQDALHVGTHPPGLFLVAYSLRSTFAEHPDFAKGVVAHVPASVVAGFRAIGQFDPLPVSDQASLATTGALILLLCAGTVVPLYLLARCDGTAGSAWSTAVLWPLVPSGILFQPAADTAFPCLSTLALALTAYAIRGTGRASLGLSFACGLVLGIGMQFTLAFLPVGLIVALAIGGGTGVPIRRRAALIIATGIGFLSVTLAFWAATGANPFVIWWWNQRNHSRFYTEYPRSYLAWVIENPIELAIAIGIPGAAWCIWGTFYRRSTPRLTWLTVAVLVVLTLSGKNLSEVARLWLPLMPLLLLAAGRSLSASEAGPKTLGVTVVLVGLQTLILQSLIQVVYPI